MTRIYAVLGFLGLLLERPFVYVRARCWRKALPTAYVVEDRVLSA